MRVIILITLAISILLTYIIWDFYRIKSQYNKNQVPNKTSKIDYIENKSRVEIDGIVYDYYDKYFANYLVVDLSDPSEVCFKSHLSASTDNSDTKKFNAVAAIDLINQPSAKLNQYKPIAAFNTAYYSKSSNIPFDVNVIQGSNYSVTRDWTSINISIDNKISFVREFDESLYNAAGGGPKIITNGKYTDPCVSGAFSKSLCIEVNEVSDGEELYNLQRTIVGITDTNKMIVIVSSFLETKNLQNVFTEISEQENAGIVIEANLFDGGSSSTLVFDDNLDGNYDANEIKQSGSPIVAAMLIFKGEACKFR